MSFSINISGHSSADHNQIVKSVAEDAVRGLRELLGPGQTVSLGGYSNDNTGRIDLVTPPPSAPSEGLGAGG